MFLLERAINVGDFSTFKQILRIDVNEKDEEGNVPLHLAVKNKEYGPEMVKELISVGADVNIANNRGITPLHLAARDGHFETVEILILAGADVNKRNHVYGWIPLDHALITYNSKIAKLLLENGSDVNNVDNDGVSSLYRAIQYEGFKMVKMLLEKGAKVNIRDNVGRTPVYHAAFYDNKTADITKILLKYGADPNIPDVEGNTPLHVVVGDNHGVLEIVKALLAGGADFNARDRRGRTLLDLANMTAKRVSGLEGIERDKITEYLTNYQSALD